MLQKVFSDEAWAPNNAAFDFLEHGFVITCKVAFKSGNHLVEELSLGRCIFTVEALVDLSDIAVNLSFVESLLRSDYEKVGHTFFHSNSYQVALLLGELHFL
jgi:hypothetical protein